MKCNLCFRVIDEFRDYFEPVVDGCICGHCINHEAAKHDRTVNPLPDHMRDLAEPYIQFREDTAVANFVLQQAESLRTSTT